MNRDELMEIGARALSESFVTGVWSDLTHGDRRYLSNNVITSILPLVTEAIAAEVETQRRALTDDIPSYHGTIRNADDMSWVLAQARDRIVRWAPSDD